MRKEIVPTLFSLDKETFNKKLKLLSFSKRIHLDFMDGKFTSDKSVSFEEMGGILEYFDTKFEVHLMAYEPASYIKRLVSLGIKKALIQVEFFHNPQNIIDTIEEFHDNDIQVFAVLNPDTSTDILSDIDGFIDGVMIMSVFPGKEGQEFIEETYDRIREIRESYPHLPIQVDGGIKDTNAKKLIECGANILSVGSYISGSDDPKGHYNRLTSLIKN